MKWIYSKQFGDVAVLENMREVSLQYLATRLLQLAEDEAEEQREYPMWGYTGNPLADEPEGELVWHKTELYIMLGEGGGICQVCAEYDKKMNLQDFSLIYTNDNGDTDNDDIYDAYTHALEYELRRVKQTANINIE